MGHEMERANHRTEAVVDSCDLSKRVTPMDVSHEPVIGESADGREGGLAHASLGIRSSRAIDRRSAARGDSEKTAFGVPGPLGGGPSIWLT